jgi:hypothetical protein
MRGASDALRDSELRWQTADKLPGFDTFYPSERGRLALHQRKEFIHYARTPTNPYENALRVVEHLTAKRKIARDAPDGRTKSDTLHTAAYANFQCDVFRLS